MTAENKKTLINQKLVLGLGLGVVCAGLISLILLGGGKSNRVGDGEAVRRSLDLEGVVRKTTLEENWLSRNELRLEQMETRLKQLDALQKQNAELTERLARARKENESLIGDAKGTLEVYERRIKQLEQQTAKPGATAVSPPSTPTSKSPFGSVSRPGGKPGPEAKLPGGRSVEILRFGTEPKEEALAKPVRHDVRYYLPPNAYARAKVLVGVDAATSVNAQADPKPMVFRIIGPAYSARQNGERLETDVIGCIVNGAAVPELSSEKVFVKLQKMTCPDGNRNVTVARVEGFVTHRGKTGVRGRVVSREGDLILKAFLSGVAGGFGRGFSANAERQFSTVGVGLSSSDTSLSPQQIAAGGVGQGLARSADAVSQYLIERAEQYQPVIEMPTGIEVELVFLNGAIIRTE
ncbi:MAG: TrbI/VirB10 family protein [bacterium]